MTARKSDNETEVAWKPKALDCVNQAETSLGINLFTTNFLGEAAAPAFLHSFTEKRNQTTDEAFENRT